MSQSPVSLALILEHEQKVWQALVDGDAELDRQMLSDDFLGVYPSGFSDRSGHVAQLAAGPSMSAYELSEARLLPLGNHQVLLAYRADYQPYDASPEDPWKAMYISSLWSFRNGRWVNVFSQDTPVSD